MGTDTESAIIERLKNWGCDTQGALERMLDDESLYVSMLLKYKDSFRLMELREYIVRQRYESTLDLAHMLKGVLGNLGLTPMYKVACKITDATRNGDYDCLLGCADELITMKERLDSLLA